MIINLVVVSIMALGLVFSHGESVVVDYIAYALMGLGVLFFLATSVGLLRFPDFYTRMHAAGKGDTLSTMLLLVGAAVYALNHEHASLHSVLLGIKILFIINFILIGSPTATHAMMDAGYETGEKHWSKNS